jgi:hypothetical protein
MEDFKPFKKVQCFKEGGSVQKEVNFKKRDRKNVEPSDSSQDKKLVKKAFAQHDKAKHGGSEPTEIKLKKGGRAKKECGTVRKYNTGGKVENAYGTKKTDKDIKDIANTKRQKPALLCGGKSVKKMANGGPTFETNPAAAQDALDTKENIATRNMIMNPARKAKKFLMDKLSGLSPMNAAVSNVGEPPPEPMPAPMKKGGKVKKMAFGGMANAVVNSAKNTVNNMPKPSQLPTTPPSRGIMGGATNAVNRAVSNIPKPAAITKPLIGGMMAKPAMPFRKKGGKVKKMNTGGTCS